MDMEQLLQQEIELRKLLSENLTNQRELNKIDFIEKNGFGVGDIVEWRNGENAVKGVISEIEFSGVKPTYYKALLFNSNGKVGKREVRIWSCEFNSMKLIEKSL